jgi:hypothetical protein
MKTIAVSDTFELIGAIRAGRLKRIYQAAIYEKHPDLAPFALEDGSLFDYIRKGRGNFIPVRVKYHLRMDFKKALVLCFLEKPSLIDNRTMLNFE